MCNPVFAFPEREELMFAKSWFTRWLRSLRRPSQYTHRSRKPARPGLGVELLEDRVAEMEIADRAKIAHRR